MKVRLNLYCEAKLAQGLDELAARRRLPKSAIVEAAIASFLSPDGADRRDAAFTRRLDRISRQLERLERDQTIMVEAFALYVGAWLAANPPVPASQRAASEAQGRARYERFLERLGRRYQQGRRIADEILADRIAWGAVPGKADEGEAGEG
ncbi:ribbon-helix-helix protein, CopG family [Phenylobacterium montanum]|uniref:Ribbon-helix-helix protein, CopG family n=1 Tax=Phenylobacterium montanum TaxID=2823693 RepID=A0A975IWS6_9CAUL|nr:ribbon-helix-helix domain-containing protein [Caulobacter sp. S6]QUD90150.1 ribbon-helix-helix protein, CopG family [Caulobacter sp. S6]